MSSFFVSSDRIQVGQTDVSIPSENGLDYRPGGRIELYVPPTSKFVDLSQSKLKMNVSLAIPTVNAANGAMRTQLDAQTGLHSLIRSIRIFSGRKTVLLEEIEGYDILTALRFDYETNDNLKAQRGLTEGATTYDQSTRGTEGTTKTIQNNVTSNPYFMKVDGNPTLSTSFATTDEDYDFKVAKGELHLNTGLFRSEAVFPALLTDGIFIEILLQDAKKVFRSLDGANRNRRLKLCPEFHSTNGSDGERATSGSLKNGSATNTLYLSRANNMTAVENVPFVVGEYVTLCTPDFDGVNGSLNASSARISQIEIDRAITDSSDKIKITLQANVSNTMGFDITAAGDALVVSNNTETATSYDCDYTVSDVELIVKQIEVPDGYEASMMNMMKEGGTMNYDYRTFTNYRYSQLQGDNVANVRLPLIESRATSILCVPTDAKSYNNREMLSCSATYLINTESDDVRNFSARSGLTGISDGLQEYQFIYDGKINPSRKVDVKKISAKNSISQQWVVEAEKALAMADIEPLSFRAFQENFFIGRALALGKNAVYDARGKDFNLQVEYTDPTNAQTKDKLWNNFVSHLRRLEIKNGGLSVMV
tara:strand:+ start:946 stop:2727 length:1782 start_codon:yes stop_codon:yes gene_type:complete